MKFNSNKQNSAFIKSGNTTQFRDVLSSDETINNLTSEQQERTRARNSYEVH